MGEFIRFINRYKRLLIFLVLQYICFYFIFNYNTYQRGIFLSTINSWSGGLNEWRSGVEDYFFLGEENERLRERIAELESNAPSSFRLVDNNFALIDDTLFRRNFTYQYGHVVQSTVGMSNNYLTVDRGRAQDVTPEMVVRSNEGLVGVVDRVSENFSLVRPIINPNFKAGGLLARTGHFGVLTWDAEDFRYAQLSDIPAEANIRVGDVVITRGENSIFPLGIPIGTISEMIKEPGASFYEIEVQLATDFSAVNSVYLIGDEFKAEIDSLKMNLPDE